MTEKGEQPVIRAVVTLIGRKNTDQERYYGFTSDVTNAGGVERRGAAWGGVVRRGAHSGVVRFGSLFTVKNIVLGPEEW